MLTLTLKPEHIQILSEALGNFPFKLASPVVWEIQRQITEQQKTSDAK